MKEKDLIGKWGGIPLTDLKKRKLDNFVCSDDLEKLEQLKQPIVECIAINTNFLTLQDGNITFRVSPPIFQVCRKPYFFLGDEVKVINSKNHIEFGVVKDFYWHVNNNIYIYILEINGKIKTRRYNEEDLQRIKDNDISIK